LKQVPPKDKSRALMLQAIYLVLKQRDDYAI